MANFPIKMLKDEEGKPFVPVVSANTISLMSGYDLQTEMDKKLVKSDIKAGRNIDVTTNSDNNEVTIAGPAIIDNVTTTNSGQGVLDAHQGKVLDDKITALTNTVNTNETDIEDKMTAVQNRATSLETRATNLEARATQTEQDVVDTNTRITNLKYSDLNDLPVIDTAMSNTSTNAVQNKVIKDALDKKVDKVSGKGLSTEDFTTTLKNKLDNIEAGAQVNTITGVKGDAEASYRTGNVNITKDNLGLGNVENKSSATIRGELTSSNVTTALGYTPADNATVGANNGIAQLDSTGKVPASQLPSYVDDVLEFEHKADFPATGESGKIYIDKENNITYRWTGTQYANIGSGLSLGETSTTAYYGDKGKVAYDHASAKGSAFTSNMYKITTNAEGHVTNAIAIEKADITGLGIPGQDTTYTAGTGLDLTGTEFSLNDSGVTAGTYGPNGNVTGTNDKTVSIPQITVDQYGRITSITNRTLTNKDTNTTYEEATQSASGLMSASDKQKLDGLATVASSGAYNDLTGKPTIPSDLGDLTNTAGYLKTESDPTVPTWVKNITEADIQSWAGKSTFDGDYNSLNNKPTIPTKVSQLTNDSGYITSYTETDPTVPAWAKATTKPTYTAAEVHALPDTTVIPTKTSELTNDSNFVTSSQLNTSLSGKQDTLTPGDNITITNNVISAAFTPVVDNLTTADSEKALSANQGVVLAERVPVAGGTEGQVLKKKSGTDYDYEWGDAADPNAIIGDGSIKKIIELTYDEYIALEDAGQVDPDTEYHITTDSDMLYGAAVVDSLTSNSAHDALSANQGRVLADMITVLDGNTVKNDQYASSSTAGIFRSGNGIHTDDSGYIYCNTYSASSFSSKGDGYVVSKGTLNNILNQKLTVSTSDPSGGSDGDIWLKVS